MAAPATKPILIEPAAATPLAMLHRDRAGVASELTGLNAASAKLNATANAEAAVLCEIADMGSADVAAMTAWASGGCIGDLPRSDQQKRIVLGQKLNAAQAAAAAAKGAGVDIDAQIRQLNERLAGLGTAIEAAALDAMQTEFGKIFDQHRAAVENIRTLTAKIVGLSSFFSNHGREQIELRANPQAGRQYLARAEALSAIRLTDPGLTRGEIFEGITFWADRAAALRKGPAA